MKLVAGLGNPGDRYRGTRHNVGFDVLDRLARRHALRFDAAPADALQARWRRGDEAVWLVKPLTFMNVSGEAVGALARYYRVETPSVLIVCDDVNLPLGRLRARASGTEGGHNGLRSVALHLGTIDYARLRIGVGRPSTVARGAQSEVDGRGDDRRDLADHVLARFDADEQPGIDVAVDRAADAIEMWVDVGLERVMNTFNRDPNV